MTIIDFYLYVCDGHISSHTNRYDWQQKAEDINTRFTVNFSLHDDVIKWKHFPRNWPFVRGIHRSRWIPRTETVTRGFDVFFDLRLNKRLSKQSWGWWFETLPRPLWRHSKGLRCVDICFYPWRVKFSEFNASRLLKSTCKTWPLSILSSLRFETLTKLSEIHDNDHWLIKLVHTRTTIMRIIFQTIYICVYIYVYIYIYIYIYIY